MTNRRTIPARPETSVFFNNEGTVTIMQEDPLEPEPHTVVLEPRDVPLIIKWLQEVYEEAIAPEGAPVARAPINNGHSN